MTSRLLTLALLLAALPAAAQLPEGTVFATSEVFCDCDPRDFVFRTRRALPGYAAPVAAGRVIRTVDVGRLIEGNDWTEARTVVRRPLRLTLTAPVTLTGVRRIPTVADGPYRRAAWDRGTDIGALPLPRGARVDVLTGSEGMSYFATEGVVYFGDNFWGEIVTDDANANARAESGDVADELWLRLRARPGRPAAWVRVGTISNESAEPVEVVCGTHDECPPGVGSRR